jgi:hypothetical protein
MRSDLPKLGQRDKRLHADVFEVTPGIGIKNGYALLAFRTEVERDSQHLGGRQLS